MGYQKSFECKSIQPSVRLKYLKEGPAKLRETPNGWRRFAAECLVWSLCTQKTNCRKFHELSIDVQNIEIQSKWMEVMRRREPWLSPRKAPTNLMTEKQSHKRIWIKLWSCRPIFSFCVVCPLLFKWCRYVINAFHLVDPAMTFIPLVPALCVSNSNRNSPLYK